MVLINMAKQRILVCPVCGETQEETSICRLCENALDADGLLCAEGSIGPWWVRDKKHPFAPGMTYDHLVALVNTGEVGRHAILRGPTTRQLWKVARRVRGIAHLVGRCHNCGEHIENKARQCPACQAPFLTYKDRNNFGVDISLPPEGSIDGMSSFLSDTVILDTLSTPLTLPKAPASNPDREDSVGSPQFNALQRRVQQGSRTIRILAVCLTICVIALIFAIVMLLK
jgi:RNA polymerase subunit RPABC4/transcription elongation factor Spt4